MKQDDAQAPATKQDIANVRQELQHGIRDLDAKLELFKDESKLHFDVASEHVRDDIRVFAEKLQDHDERIVRIERHPRLAAA